MRIKLLVDAVDAFAKDWRELADDFCWPDSDFQNKLRAFLAGKQPTLEDGYLALVKIDGAIAGWARTEQWDEDAATAWDTLEAFVAPEYRNRGVASMAALALAAGPIYGSGEVAVFSPAMMLVARKAGLFPQLFSRQSVERWVRA